MYSAKEEAFLKDIQEASRRIHAYTEDTDYDAFCADIKITKVGENRVGSNGSCVV